MSTKQLVACGLSSSGISRRVTRGHLHPRHRVAFSVGHPGVTPEGRWMAAVLAGGDGAVLSHRSLAALHAVGIEDQIPEITVPGARRRGPRGLIVHGGQLDPRDVRVVRGIPVTSVEQMLLDLAELLTHRELVHVLDRVLARRLFDARALDERLARCNGRRGLKALRVALMEVRPQQVLTRSELERRALRLLKRHRLPMPEVNAHLFGHEVDLMWADRRFVVELDGREVHNTPDAFERDRRRDADRLARGWLVMRLTWRQVVNDERWVASRIAGVLDLRPGKRD